MKRLSIIIFIVLTFSLHCAIESSISIPVREHSNHIFVHERDNAVYQMEYQQYLMSLAPMSENEIETILKARGFEVRSIKLRDLNSYLIYETYVKDANKSSSVIYIDPKSGLILKRQN